MCLFVCVYECLFVCVYECVCLFVCISGFNWWMFDSPSQKISQIIGIFKQNFFFTHFEWFQNFKYFILFSSKRKKIYSCFYSTVDFVYFCKFCISWEKIHLMIVLKIKK